VNVDSYDILVNYHRDYVRRGVKKLIELEHFEELIDLTEQVVKILLARKPDFGTRMTFNFSDFISDIPLEISYFFVTMLDSERKHSDNFRYITKLHTSFLKEGDDGYLDFYEGLVSNFKIFNEEFSDHPKYKKYRRRTFMSKNNKKRDELKEIVKNVRQAQNYHSKYKEAARVALNLLSGHTNIVLIDRRNRKAILASCDGNKFYFRGKIIKRDGNPSDYERDLWISDFWMPLLEPSSEFCFGCKYLSFKRKDEVSITCKRFRKTLVTSEGGEGEYPKPLDIDCYEKS